MKKVNRVIAATLIGAALIFTACKKDKKDDPTNPTSPSSPAQEKKYALVIDNGAQSIEVGQSMNLTAHLVNTSGATLSASGVQWSSNIGGISGSAFSLNTETTGVISASIQYDGVTYSASVPISVQPLKNTQVFAVVPSAIIWSTGAGTIPLETVYFGNSSASYAFSSQNTNIVTVSSAGVVSFVSAGSTTIIVNATIGGQTHTVTVPVLVVGQPEVALPVTRVVVTPALGEMFRGETLQLTAKAYNSNGDDVSSTVSFSYLVVPKLEDDNEPQTSISVNGSGLVTALTIGGAYVKVTANGIVGQSEIVVNPDTAIIVSPFYAELGGIDPQTFQPNPTSRTFTATTYKVDRNAYKAGNPNFLTVIPNPANLVWEIPTTGIPEIDNIFNIITLSNGTNTSVTATSIQGKVGSTFVVAHAGLYGGAAAVMVNP
jgi:hypothetical protein